MHKVIGACLVVAMGSLLAACESSPKVVETGMPSAVVADAETGRFALEFDASASTCPSSVPLKTRWKGEVVEGLLIPTGSAGARAWVYSAPSERSGVGSLFIPVSVTWKNDKWTIQKETMSFTGKEVLSAATTPMAATIPVRHPSVTRAGLLSYPGMMRSCQVVFLPSRYLGGVRSK